MTREIDIDSQVERYKKDLNKSLNIYSIRMLCNDFALGLSSDEAKEYIYQGVLRRFMLLKRCIENINSLCPIDAEVNIGKSQSSDLIINLHAFYINIQGLLDNIAWVFIYEKSVDINKSQVGLFRKKIKTFLPVNLADYLTKMEKWFFNYSKLYRDCLAHRIPLYAPKLMIKNYDRYKELEVEKGSVKNDIDEWLRIMEEQELLFEPPKIIYTSDLEGLQGVKLHAQTLVDFVTVKAIIEKAFT